MEVNQDRAKAAKDCFDFNKKFTKVHVTSDLNCFPYANDAVNHARSLTDKTIDVFDRQDDDVTKDEDGSDEVTAESNTNPNPSLAEQKAKGEGQGKEFVKAPTQTVTAAQTSLEMPATKTEIKPAADQSDITPPADQSDVTPPAEPTQKTEQSTDNATEGQQ